MGEDARVQIYMESREGAYELGELTDSLGAIARQFNRFATSEYGASARRGEANLYVRGLKEGSIDILLDPSVVLAAGAVGAALPLIGHTEVVLGFLKHISGMIEYLRGGRDEPPRDVTASDCDDYSRIAGPVAARGGTQNFNAVQGDQHNHYYTIDVEAAVQLMEGAARKKAELQFPSESTIKNVSLVWHALTKDPAKPDGARSPHKAIIEDIDPDPKAVFWDESVATTKEEMLSDTLYKRVYFVDVRVSRASGKITSYTIVGYHGSDLLDPD